MSDERWFGDHVPGTTAEHGPLRVEEHLSVSPGVDELRWAAPVRPGDEPTPTAGWCARAWSCCGRTAPPC